MELLKLGVKKHPYISVFIAWLYTFMMLGRFQIDGVMPVNYISPIVFALVFIIAEMLFVKKCGANEKEIKTALVKTSVGALAVTVYMELMLKVFSTVPCMTSMEGRNSLVPFLFGLAAVAFIAIWMTAKKKWTDRRVTLAIFLLGAIFHVFFMLYLGMLYQRDAGQILGNGHGHLGYIEYIHNNLWLPQFDPREKWQYYHPPLNHIVSALFMKAQTLLGVDIRVAVYNLTYPPLLYYMFTLIVFMRLTDELGLRKDMKKYVLLVCTFSPIFFYMGVYVNNDMMSVMFMMLSIYLALRWYRERTTSAIIRVAFAFGAGMLAKLSSWMAAVPIAVVFIAALIEDIKSKDKKKFLGKAGQMCIFMLIAAPLSLYWSIRNYVRFGVPFGYVPVGTDLTQVIPQDTMTRLFDFNLSQFSTPWIAYVIGDDGYNEYNPLIGLIKTSCTSFKGETTFSSLCLIITILLCVVSFVCMCVILFGKNDLSLMKKLMLSGFYLVLMISYYIFCLKYPHVCTEDARYVSPVIFIGAYFTAYALGRMKERKRFRPLRLAGTGLIVMYSVSSALEILSDGLLFSLV